MPYPPEPRLPQLTAPHTPELRIDPDTGEHSLEFSVLIYNIADLPWPVRLGRRSQIKKIGDKLAAMRSEGRVPDILLLQEAFTGHVKYLIEGGNYPNFVRGPSRGDWAPKISEGVEEEFVKNARFWKGEKLGKLINSGLYAMTHFPIRGKITQPFKRKECAGSDCLSNKGILGFGLEIPGLPVPLQVFTTHLNSWETAGVSPERSHRAHQLQINELFHLIEAYRNPDYPLVFGGDFNMRGAEDRMTYAGTLLPYIPASGYCLFVATDCDIKADFDSDEPWKDTQDLHGFASGSGIAIRPIRWEQLFDGPENGGKLSDHEAHLVTYLVTWQPEATADPSALLPGGLYQAGPGAVCLRDRMICYDRSGPSVELTRRYVGDLFIARVMRMKELAAGSSGGRSRFSPTPGIECDPQRRTCIATGYRCLPGTLSCKIANKEYPALSRVFWPAHEN